MGKIQASPNLIKKLLFIQKHCNKVVVSPNGISSRYINVQLACLSDCSFGIETKELVEMLKYTNDFNLIDKKYIEYNYTCFLDDQEAYISKNIPLFDLSYTFNFQSPICTLKLPFFKSISSDETEIEFLNGKLILETRGYIKTRIVFDAQRVEGTEYFRAKAKGTDLKIIEEIEGERVLCYFENSLVIFGFDQDLNTAIVIKCLV